MLAGVVARHPAALVAARIAWHFAQPAPPERIVVWMGPRGGLSVRPYPVTRNRPENVVVAVYDATVTIADVVADVRDLAA